MRSVNAAIFMSLEWNRTPSDWQIKFLLGLQGKALQGNIKQKTKNIFLGSLRNKPDCIGVYVQTIPSPGKRHQDGYGPHASLDNTRRTGVITRSPLVTGGQASIPANLAKAKIATILLYKVNRGDVGSDLVWTLTALSTCWHKVLASVGKH